ncbi:MAG: ABC transporter substrate-binding protein [Spirochaetaceae bacterium]|jgi:NitT/TauT family transport system substrate-binding protein|nr:ABC transporter substrate-binding protein [Spirochaetaceae bacterium]
MSVKKGILLTALMCAVLFGAYAKGQGEGSAAVAEEDYVLKIGYGITAGLCSAPFFIAQELGYYEEEGLNYEVVRIDSGQGPQLLVTGQIDAVNNLLATLIQPIANGLDVKVTLGIHTGCIKVLVSPNSPIRRPVDLRGKRIGTSSMNASGTVITQRYLAELGIGVSADNLEVEWVIFPASDLPLALERGLVDAIAINDPTAYIVESEGKGRVIINSATDDYLKNEFCCVVVASTAIAQRYPATLARFTRAIQRAANFVQENPEETARLMAERRYVAGEPAVNAAILRTYDFRASVSEAETAIARNARDLQRIGLVEASVDAAALTRDTFLRLPGVPDTLH